MLADPWVLPALRLHKAFGKFSNLPIRNRIENTRIFNGRRQALKDYFLGAFNISKNFNCIGTLSFYDSKKSIGGASFLSIDLKLCKSHCRT